MPRFLRSLAALLTVYCLFTSVGCETTKPSEQSQWVPVPITELSNIAGKWEGLMRTIPPTKREDWAALVIDPDGSFRFASVRTIGVLSGGGQFTINNGHLVASSERGSIDASLYEADQHRLLRAKARGADGTEYIVELRPHK